MKTAKSVRAAKVKTPTWDERRELWCAAMEAVLNKTGDPAQAITAGNNVLAAYDQTFGAK